MRHRPSVTVSLQDDSTIRHLSDIRAMLFTTS